MRHSSLRCLQQFGGTTPVRLPGHLLDRTRCRAALTRPACGIHPYRGLVRAMTARSRTCCGVSRRFPVYISDVDFKFGATRQERHRGETFVYESRNRDSRRRESGNSPAPRLTILQAVAGFKRYTRPKVSGAVRTIQTSSSTSIAPATRPSAQFTLPKAP